jgi:glucose 1-dehydrogenase
MARLSGKVALVTGASRGIGRGIALELARDGADVVINYRTHPEEAQDTATAVAALGCHALVWHLDIAIANAAYSIREPVIEAQWEHVLRTIEVSEFGVFHTCQMAAQQMVKQSEQGRHGGKIVIISSVMEEICFPGSAAYQMAKGAINCLGRTMAAELASYHINVNIVNPGWIDTPGERRFATDEELKAYGELIPWGRLGMPAEIGQVVAFLVSEEARYVTGATLRADGGYIGGLRLGRDGAF